MASTKTIAFIGASTGVGLSALKHAVAAGYQCTALCRVPSKLSSIFPSESTPNLKIIEGNALDIKAVSQCLDAGNGKLVDFIVSTIGSRPVWAKWKMSIEDPTVCQNAMANVLEALAQLRNAGLTGNPHIIPFSTTGMSKYGRDYPIVLAFFYLVLLKVPHEDKQAMEDKLINSGESYTIVRGSLLTNGETTRTVRVGIEDDKTGRESEAIGYTITREDAGKWVLENLVSQRDEKYQNKILMITT
ncbi:hypothetical protein N7509_004565 [Penicillium cosmopolitanum]|uniref:NAD(P)-binding domain-containing protein n=1 Tax=Penicillium cosmopolitanum TaxID=1131564 RepID=A0A9X0B9A2_9EURO|nr:uncharacterized protein N7509_004565 [Penicillium cosmopolitanum]KAJ5396452.1 hypothetical protein N7509_004565 [Penicillium cosmopolitanum]